MTTETTPAISPVKQIELLYQRLQKARSIVVAGKVRSITGMADQYVVEGSSRGTFYLVNGICCACIDAQQRVGLHQSYCKHKLAVELYKEQQEQTQTTKAESPESKAELDRKVADLYN
jgi:hypothetical protein